MRWLLVLALLLAGCGPSDGGRYAVDEAVRASDAAVAGVLHRLAIALRLDAPTGARSFAICGDALAPRGVVVRTLLRFPAPSGIPPERTAAVLRADGWAAGRKGVLTLRVDDAGDAVQVSLVSDCVATSREVARRYDERPPAEVGWS
ncbi:hypothetical protein GCM10022237_16090 [Nocardioides ginsengisoli]|uniref:Lipoprotein n=1 Tax=Nocardioides ginsengisoli TaxID=363868 RepID=A0ABW3W353_9ACTN